MCPFCMANLALVVAGTVSTGGVAAVIAGKLRSKNRAREISANFKRRIKSRVRPVQLKNPPHSQVSSAVAGL